MGRLIIAAAGAGELSARVVAALAGVAGVEVVDGGALTEIGEAREAPLLLVLPPLGGAFARAALARGYADLGAEIAGLALAGEPAQAAAVERLSGLPVVGTVAGVADPRPGSATPSAGATFDLDRLAALAAPPPRRGEVYLVGAGPGDPELLTLKAVKLIRRADVALFDRLARSPVMDLIPLRAERIYVGKRPGAHALTQDEISALMVRLAREGKRVLRLKGGDPFLFGRGGEEAETLAAAGVKFEVCPGVTAASGAGASALIPLTHRDHAQACIFVTGQGKDGPTGLDWPALIRTNQTVAIYMGLAHLDALMAEFIAHGAPPDTPAAIVDNATRPNQKVIVGEISNLGAEAAAAGLRGPAIVFVGSVATLRAQLLAAPA
jgi:uroporphyrin-III C-methyltransferase